MLPAGINCDFVPLFDLYFIMDISIDLSATLTYCSSVFLNKCVLYSVYLFVLLTACV